MMSRTRSSKARGPAVGLSVSAMAPPSVVPPAASLASASVAPAAASSGALDDDHPFSDAVWISVPTVMPSPCEAPDQIFSMSSSAWSSQPGPIDQSSATFRPVALASQSWIANRMSRHCGYGTLLST